MHPLESGFLRVVAAALLPLDFRVIAGFGQGRAFARAAGTLQHQLYLHIPIDSTHIEIAPTLGIYHPKVSELSSEFRGLQPSRVASVGRSLDDLIRFAGAAPRARRVAHFEEVDSQVEKLVSDVAEFGMPFFESFQDLADLASTLKQRARSLPENEHLAIICALLGDQPGMAAALNNVANASQSQPDEVAAQTRLFVESFVSHFHIGDTG